MCVNRVYLRSRGIYVDCGSCSACRQHAANKRAQRIRFTRIPHYTAWFVHLTYSNDFVPYVRLSDLLAFQNSDDVDVLPVSIFRNSSSRYYRDCQIIHNNPKVLDTRILPKPSAHDLHLLRPLRNDSSGSDRVGVLYQKDVQDFLKRFRITFTRLFGRSEPVYYFQCGEYGATYQRPHFHCVIWLPSDFKRPQLLQLLGRCWPYCDYSRFVESVEVCRNVSSYVASYVNCGDDCSPYLQKFFKPKTSFSTALGLSYEYFNPALIYSNYLQSRSVEYPYSFINTDGTFDTKFFPYPKYIKSRYFPKPPQFGTLTFNQFLQLCDAVKDDDYAPAVRRVQYDAAQRLDMIQFKSIVNRYGKLLCFKLASFKYWVSRFRRFLYDLSPFRGDVAACARLIYDYYTSEASHLYRNLVEKSADVSYLVYDNLDYVVARYSESNCEQFADIVSLLPDTSYLSPNSLPDVLTSTRRLTRQFNKYFKHRKLLDYGQYT